MARKSYNCHHNDSNALSTHDNTPSTQETTKYSLIRSTIEQRRKNVINYFAEHTEREHNTIIIINFIPTPRHSADPSSPRIVSVCICVCLFSTKLLHCCSLRNYSQILTMFFFFLTSCSFRQMRMQLLYIEFIARRQCLFFMFGVINCVELKM